MAEVKQKPKSPAKKPDANSNKGFALVSQTVTTTMQNSAGVKRTIRETTYAPKKQVQPAKPPEKKPKKQPAKSSK